MTRPILMLEGCDIDMIGPLPMWLDEADPRPAREQLDEHYRHGGGWQPFKGFKYDKKHHTLKYPGDPPLRPLALMKFRNEMIVWYPHAWIMILQKGGDFEVCRMD